MDHMVEGEGGWLCLLPFSVCEMIILIVRPILMMWGKRSIFYVRGKSILYKYKLHGPCGSHFLLFLHPMDGPDSLSHIHL